MNKLSRKGISRLQTSTVLFKRFETHVLPPSLALVLAQTIATLCKVGAWEACSLIYGLIDKFYAHNALQVDVGRVWLTFSSCLLAFVFVFGAE
jgi:hypothetical protein